MGKVRKFQGGDVTLTREGMVVKLISGFRTLKSSQGLSLSGQPTPVGTGKIGRGQERLALGRQVTCYLQATSHNSGPVAGNSVTLS